MSEEKPKDLNDRAKDGTLPEDPGLNAKTIAADVPRIYTVRELLADANKRAFIKQERANGTTGHHQLDSATGGFRPGFVWVFGADTSWGKSSFAIMIADENIKQGRRVMIVSAEDSKELYGDRLLLRRSRVNADAHRLKRLGRADADKMAEAVARGEDVPIFLDARGRSVEWVTKQVPLMIREHGVDHVLYDYLQAFDNEKPQQDRRNQVTYIARVLTDSLKLANVSGIIFSQITIEKGKDYPDKHSIRESRDVSNSAEAVILGFTPSKPIVQGGRQVAEAGNRCVLIDKCKNGRRGVFLMDWDDNSACFNKVDDPETERIKGIIGHEWDQYGDEHDDWRNR
jgi:replicative DNA helicase